VNRDGIGQNHLIKLRKVVDDLLSIKIDGQFSLFFVDLDYPSNVSVKDFFVVFVGNLHDLVAQFERPAAVEDPRRLKVQLLLKLKVEIGHTDRSPMHGRQDLNILDRIEFKTFWNPFRTERKNSLQSLLRVLFLDKIEICLLRELGEFALVDPVCIDNDHAFHGLAEDLGEPDHGCTMNEPG
jgi:hypothetical protein